MRAKVRLVAVLSLLAASLAAPARAGVITYDLTSLGGDQWRYDYAVTNDTLAAPLAWFTVFFPLGDYDSLGSLAATAPSGWDAFVAQPDPLLPDDGFLDVSTTGPGIAPGETLGGFSIDFRWLGAGTPGSQPFDFIGLDPADPLQSGMTTPRAPTSVPEPGTLPLLALGLLALGLYSRLLARFVASATMGATASATVTADADPAAMRAARVASADARRVEG